MSSEDGKGRPARHIERIRTGRLEEGEGASGTFNQYSHKPESERIRTGRLEPEQPGGHPGRVPCGHPGHIRCPDCPPRQQNIADEIARSQMESERQNRAQAEMKRDPGRGRERTLSR